MSILMLRSFEYFHFGRDHIGSVPPVLFNPCQMQSKTLSQNFLTNISEFLRFFRKQNILLSFIPGARLWPQARPAAPWSSRCMTPRSDSLCPAESRSREAALSWPTDPRPTSSNVSPPRLLLCHLLVAL